MGPFVSEGWRLVHLHGETIQRRVLFRDALEDTGAQGRELRRQQPAISVGYFVAAIFHENRPELWPANAALLLRLARRGLRFPGPAYRIRPILFFCAT